MTPPSPLNNTLGEVAVVEEVTAEDQSAFATGVETPNETLLTATRMTYTTALQKSLKLLPVFYCCT